MKINWGTAIIIAYILFAGMLVVYMVLASNNPSDLVSEDYYEQEIKYQDRIKNTANAKAIGDLKIEQSADGFHLRFPAGLNTEKLNGMVHFYRPNKADLDQKTVLIFAGSNSQIFQKANFVKGLWLVKVDVNDGAQNYYWEHNLSL